MIVGVFALGVIISYVQYGFVPGADRVFSVAGVAVPIWHLFWMGFWTGYIVSLP